MIGDAGRAAALAVALVLLAPARPAHACGTGGDGDSSSSSSSSDGDSSSSSELGGSVAAVPACEDTTDVHGYRTCTRFGAWSGATAPISFELGTTTTQVDLSGIAIDGNVEHSDGAAYAYRVVGADLGASATAVGLTGRILGHRRRTYAGIEASAAGLVTDATARMEVGTGATLAPRAAVVIAGGAVVGARVFVGRLSLGGELMAGVRAIGVSSESRHDACVVTDTRYQIDPVAEARARADLWLSPWLSAGAYVGRDVRGGNTSAALLLGAHFSAFDGGR